MASRRKGKYLASVSLIYPMPECSLHLSQVEQENFNYQVMVPSETIIVFATYYFPLNVKLMPNGF